MTIQLSSDALIEALKQKYGFKLDNDGKVDIDLHKLDASDFVALFNAYITEEGEGEDFFLVKVDEDTVESHVDGRVTHIPLSVLKGSNIKDEIGII